MLLEGNMIFYPNHGVGTVETKELMKIKGVQKEYYKIYFEKKKMHIFVSCENESQSGLRPISTMKELEIAKEDFSEKNNPLPEPNNHRSVMLEAKLKTGTMLDHRQIMRDLLHYRVLKGKLSPADKKIYKLAEDFLLEEIVTVRNISYMEANTEIQHEIKDVFHISYSEI